MSTIVSITDIAGNKAPFEEEFGIGSDDFISIDEILGTPFNILQVKEFTNDKGDGVFALINVKGELHYITTHSIGLVGMMTNEAVKQMLAEGKQVSGTIVKRKSKTSDRLVYAFA